MLGTSARRCAPIAGGRVLVRFAVLRSVPALSVPGRTECATATRQESRRRCSRETGSSGPGHRKTAAQRAGPALRWRWVPAADWRERAGATSCRWWCFREKRQPYPGVQGFGNGMQHTPGIAPRGALQYRVPVPGASVPSSGQWRTSSLETKRQTPWRARPGCPSTTGDWRPAARPCRPQRVVRAYPVPAR